MKKRSTKKIEGGGSTSKGLLSKVRTSLHLRFHSREEREHYRAMLEERRKAYAGRNKVKSKQPNTSLELMKRLRVKRQLQGTRDKGQKRQAA